MTIFRPSYFPFFLGQDLVDELRMHQRLKHRLDRLVLLDDVVALLATG
jgi:hypothetical protein